ncbi:MAG: cell surface protein [Alistipes sp.]|nr:cell surface protein [Alistipes sp.]
MKQFIVILSIALITLSCNRDGVIEAEGGVPQIELGEQAGVYAVKVGEQVEIAPQYINADSNTVYSWSIDGVRVATTPVYTFTAQSAGEVFILLEVANSYGSDSEEFRVDVADLEIPTVTITAAEQMTLAVGSTYHFRASAKQTSLPTTLRWLLGSEQVAEGFGYIFEATAAGHYTLTVTAVNSDGEHSDSVEIEVLAAEDMPFVWEFASTNLSAVVGREMLIEPTECSDPEGVTYYWQSENQPTDISREARYTYTPQSRGRHTIKATASTLRGGETMVVSKLFTIDVYEEGEFLRPETQASVANCNKVYDFTPAPGQFINENYTATTPVEACAVALERMQAGTYVSLGGFGGYIVVGFDHSVQNGEGYDFAVDGNSFNSSSEPGIVWVMQDENGDGMPNDTWYELAGSETGKETTIRGYEVTYFRPSGAGMSVQWVDNLGQSGEVAYLASYHKQEYYYPEWITAESYTLRGTRLEARNYDKYGNGAMWIQPPYDWGYADNYSSVDRLAEGEGSDNKAMPNGFDISKAIDHSGKSIELKFIDFVKVQTACNTSSGWLGENSTEVFGIYDIQQ